MVRKIEWTYSSIQDRLQIFIFWRNHNKSDSYSKKLEGLFLKSAELLSKYPEIGIKTDYEGVRVKVVKGFKIFYSFSDKKIQIIRVWDPRQDPKRFNIK